MFHSKEVLQRQQWDIPIARSSQGLVSAGKTLYDFEVILEQDAPSSIRGRRSWLNYRFEATLHRGFPRRNMTFKQDVWTFNSCLPLPHPDFFPHPLVYSGIWESHLPFTCSIPNDTVFLGQTVPMTIHFEPFVNSSGHLGQELVIVSAVVKFKQYTRLWRYACPNGLAYDLGRVFKNPDGSITNGTSIVLHDFYSTGSKDPLLKDDHEGQDCIYD
jgi:hypothetical protein